MKLLYKLSIVSIVSLVSIVILVIGIIIWCMRKRYIEKFEYNDTSTIISSFSNLVDQMLMRKALNDEGEADESDDDINENNSV